MKRKHVLFNILEKLEHKNIDKQAIKIKHLHLTIQKYDKQLQLLNNYQKEYLSVLYATQKLGLDLSCWQNYHKFLFLLSELILENQKKINQQYKNIKKELNIWLKYKIKLKTWEYLNKKMQKKYQIQKKLEQESSNECFQLKLFQSGY